MWLRVGNIIGNHLFTLVVVIDAFSVQFSGAFGEVHAFAISRGDSLQIWLSFSVKIDRARLLELNMQKVKD